MLSAMAFLATRLSTRPFFAASLLVAMPSTSHAPGFPAKRLPLPRRAHALELLVDLSRRHRCCRCVRHGASAPPRRGAAVAAAMQLLMLRVRALRRARAIAAAAAAAAAFAAHARRRPALAALLQPSPCANP